MRFSKKIAALTGCIILLGSLNISAATVDGKDNLNLNIEGLSISEWNEYKDAEPTFLLNTKDTSLNTYSKLDKKMLKGEDTSLVLHNNGNPIETNLNINQNDGYPLFAVYIDDINGQKYISYYYDSVEKRNINELIEEVKDTESKRYIDISEAYSKNTKAEARSIIRNVSWGLNTSGGTKKGVVSTTLTGNKTSANIDGKKGSVWDISSVSQAEMNSSLDYIRVQKTRLSLAGSSTEMLIDWAPDMNGITDRTFTLNGLINPREWKFSAGGYKYNDLSSKSGRYGRWEFLSPGVARTKVKTNPTIRATNLKGQFYVEASHSVQSSSGFYQPGIKGVYFTDL